MHMGELICEPASVASRSSALSARSRSSNTSSSRGNGVQMKTRKNHGASTSAKGKGKEARPSGMHRTHSSNRIYRLQTGPGGLTGGTIQRSKLGGRTAAASAHPSTLLVPSQFARPPQHSSRRPPSSGVSMHPPPPAPVSKLVREEKSTRASSSESRSQSAARRSASSRRSSKSSNSAKGKKLSAAAVSASQRRLDINDDSDYSTDTEWDTEDASEEAEATSEDNEKAIADRKLSEAAAEAQRQRDLFAKVDRRSYSDLTRVRTQPGLLTAIFHPDPQLFPPDHPYRQTRSTQDILAHLNRPSYQPAPLQPARSTAAPPVAAAVTAQGVGSPAQIQNHVRQRSPLRLKGRPQDVEESESEDDDNKLHISESVAQQRLAMLHRQHTRGPQPGPSRLTQQAPVTQQAQQGPMYSAGGQAPAARTSVPLPEPAPLPRVSTEPIPLGYPYDLLPLPMPPSTPRTIRRNMLTNELSESLRRNLLWERQVTKQRPFGMNRRAVTNAPSGLRTSNTAFTAMNANAQQSGNARLPNGTAVSDGQVPKDERPKDLKRNWSDDFHVTGW